MANCSASISNVDMKKSVLCRELPKLDMKDPETTIAWYYMRSIFLNFGRRFTVRIFWYCSLVLPICIAIFVLIFLQLFNVITDENNFYIVNLLFLSVLTLWIIIDMSMSAVKINDYFDIHIDLILKRQSEIMDAMNHCNSTKCYRKY
jgi:hypothetical protein